MITGTSVPNILSAPVFLNFTGIKIADEYIIRKILQCRNLKSLFLETVDANLLKGINGLERLEVLALTGTGLTDDDMRYIAGLKNLKALSLYNNNLTRVTGLENFPGLRPFYLSNNRIGKLENLAHLVNLKTLDLYNNQVAQLENLEQLTSLQYLYLQYNNLGTTGDKSITLPAAFANLKELVLNGPAYVNPGAIETIKGMENLKNIEVFEFAYQNLLELPDLSGLTAMCSLLIEKCPNLQQIDYQKFPVSLEALTLWNVNLKNLDGIEYLVQLKELWIGDNPGLTSLSNLNAVKTLKRLNTALCTNLPAAEITKLENPEAIMIPADHYPARVIKEWEANGIKVETF